MTRVPIPLVVDADCFLSGCTETIASMRVGSYTWYNWLGNNQNTSFAFRSQQRVFTARREHQRHGAYWYAYRKRYGKTYKTYLGKSEELTIERLQAAAAVLSSRVDTPAQANIASMTSLQPLTSLAAANSPLLMTKFSVPPLPTARVVRPHLIACLETGRKGKLIILSAPAGWGKTTLLSEWCAELFQQGMSFAWVTLNLQDADLAIFLTTLINAFQVVQPGFGGAAFALLRRSQAPLDIVLRTFIYELQSLSTDTLLLLDDCQYLPLTHQQALTFFVDNLPPHVHLIMAGRTDPPLSMAKLRVQGQLLELRAVNLAFTVQETHTLLVDTLHLPVSREICALLAERTEGWAAGLRLAALATQSADDTADIVNMTNATDVIATFGGSNRYAVDYVVEEVLLKLPPDMQSFLLHTSILNKLNASLCDAVCESSDSQARLDDLVQMNLCVALPGQEQPQYRYYRLFGEALRARLRQAHPALEAELQRRASLWYEQQGMVAEALHYARAGADKTIVARLLKSKEQEHVSSCEEIDAKPVEPVTRRERDVLSLLVKGASNREIAQMLIISEGTVKKHVSNICSKLGVRRRTQAITRALALL